jgi:hypothetical protein
VNITDLLAQAGGLKSIARELGVNEQQVSSGAAALLPALRGGFRKQAQAGGGGDAVAQLLGSLGGSGLLENVLSQHPTDVAQGNALLGTLFGSKEVSRAVAQGAAQQSGVDPALLKKMLPMLAMAVGGMMMRQQGGASAAGTAAPAGGALGALGGLVGGLLGGGRGAAPAAGALGGALLGMLDQDGDGNPLDDVMRMLGK